MARNSAGRSGALKLLRVTDRVERFRREIQFLVSAKDRPRISRRLRVTSQS
jgi:hypothetical protein